MRREGLEGGRRVVFCEVCWVRRRVRPVVPGDVDPREIRPATTKKEEGETLYRLVPVVLYLCCVLWWTVCIFVSMEIFRNFIQWYHLNKQTLLGHEFPLSTDWLWVVTWSVRQAILCSARVPVHMVLLLFGLESQGADSIQATIFNARRH